MTPPLIFVILKFRAFLSVQVGLTSCSYLIAQAKAALNRGELLSSPFHLHSSRACTSYAQSLPSPSAPAAAQASALSALPQRQSPSKLSA